MKTALIIRPPGDPVRVLEIDGPNNEFDPHVHSYPQSYLTVGKVDDFKVHFQRSPRPASSWTIDENSMGRCIRLLATFKSSDPRVILAIAEIRRRILCAHPMALDGV